MSSVASTPDRLLSLYETVFGESGRDDRAPSIVSHLVRVAEAPTLEDAEKVIAWWDCWAPYGPHHLRRTTRRLRKALSTLEGTS